MDKNKVYAIVEYILNEADQEDIEVIKIALKKRISSGSHSPMGINISNMADKMAKGVTEQVGGSIDQIRQSVQEFVVKMIKEKVPDISQEHLNELLKAWVPNPEDAGIKKDLPIPPDMLMDMLKQFIAYSNKELHDYDQAKLQEAMVDWQKEYWEGFPIRIKKLIYLFLGGQINEEEFWSTVEYELYPT
jgi:hypothetical protein